jgi:Domain of unknown function (DUF4112)
MTKTSLDRADQPEVRTRSPRQVENLRTLTRLLDHAFRIPGTNYRFGLDAILGLVPGLGDALGGALSAFVIYHAARMGASKATLTRMIGNVIVDTVVGGIPLLGDLFDFGWKANTRNLALLEQHLERPIATKAASRRLLIGLGAGLLLLLVGIVALGVMLGNYLLELAR